MKSALCLVATMLIPIALNAQTPSAVCPVITIDCSTELAGPGKPITIRVNLSGADRDGRLTFNWTVSAGEIISGQNSSAITVDASDLAGPTITARVEIDGLPAGCDRVESCSRTQTDCHAPLARRFDSYGSLSFEKEKSRLDHFGIQLQQEPGSQGYILFYGTRRMKQRLEQTRRFLADKFGINPRRITGMNGGHRRKSTVELWIVPLGASPPEPNPRF